MDIFQRLSQGPGRVDPMQTQDYDDWNQMVGAAPRDRFGQAAYQAVEQVDPDEYYQHVAPGVGGTDPLGMLPQQQRAGVAQTLLGSLFNSGVDQRQIVQGAGVRSLDPNSMSPDELANLLAWTRRNNPQAFSQVAQQYQNEPNILESLLGNKALMALLAGVGGQMFTDRMNRGGQGQGGGGIFG